MTQHAMEEPALFYVRLLFASGDLIRLGALNREEGLTLLVVEQNANLALAIGSRGYVLETGRIITEGTAEALGADDGVRKAYLGF